MLRFVLGLALLVFAFLVGWLLEGGDPSRLWGASAFTITFFVPFFAVLSVWTFKQWGAAFSHAFGTRPTPDDGRRSVALWLLWERLAILGGVLGFLGGLMLILPGMAAEGAPFDLNRFGRSMGVAMVAPVYGLLLGIFGRILKTRIEENLL